jgi:hypothetical protein
MQRDVRSDRRDHPDVIALLRGRLQGMHALPPPESVHVVGLPGLRLETGATDAFAFAHRLHARFGSSDRAPFGDPAPDPHSRFMALSLAAIAPAR